MNVRQFDLNLLVTLHALLLERSVTRAAQRVHLSQPAVSNSLKRLREVFGDPLMIRTPRGMELTPRAASLLEPVQDALKRVDRLLATDSAFDPAMADLTLHIAVSEYVAFVLMPSLLQDLRATAPGIRLVVKDVDRDDPLYALRHGKVDLMAAFIPDPPPDLAAKTLFRDSWVCIYRKTPGAPPKRLTRRMFSSAAHISLPTSASGTGATAYSHRVLRESGVDTCIAVSMPHYLSIPQVVSSTDLLMTIPSRLARSLARQVPLGISKLPVRIPGFAISLLWHPRTESDSAQAWVRERLVAAARRVAAAKAADAVSPS